MHFLIIFPFFLMYLCHHGLLSDKIWKWVTGFPIQNTVKLWTVITFVHNSFHFLSTHRHCICTFPFWSVYLIVCQSSCISHPVRLCNCILLMGDISMWLQQCSVFTICCSQQRHSSIYITQYIHQRSCQLEGNKSNVPWRWLWSLYSGCHIWTSVQEGGDDVCS